MTKNILDSKRNPINRTAARVLSKGEHYVSKKKMGTACDADFLPVRHVSELQGAALDLFLEMQGRRFGRMTVLGYSATIKNRWVVRCSCGTYTTRTMKAIRNPENRLDCCQQCRHLLFLKRAEVFRRTGKDVNISDVY